MTIRWHQLRFCANGVKAILPPPSYFRSQLAPSSALSSTSPCRPQTLHRTRNFTSPPSRPPFTRSPLNVRIYTPVWAVGAASVLSNVHSAADGTVLLGPCLAYILIRRAAPGARKLFRAAGEGARLPVFAGDLFLNA